MSALPGGKVFARQQVVGVLRRLGRDVDDYKRHHQRLGIDLVRAGARLGEMDRGIEVRARMFDDAPPIEVEAIFLEVELFLKLDARHAEEGRKIGRHRVGKVDRRPKPSQRRGGNIGWRGGGRDQARGRCTHP